MTFYKKLPLISDFFNLRAENRSSERTLIDILMVAIPASLGAIFTITDLTVKLLSQLPRSAIFVQAGIPVLLMLVSSYIIVSRKTEKRRSNGLPGRVDSYFRYQFAEPARVTSKLAFLPLAALSAFYVWGIVPNFIAGRNEVAGFICRASDGQAISDGYVEVLDAAGDAVSVMPESLDSRGFFYCDLKHWSGQPQSLRLSIPSCSSKQILIRDAVESATCCPQDKISELKSPRFKVWIVTCN